MKNSVVGSQKHDREFLEQDSGEAGTFHGFSSCSAVSVTNTSSSDGAMGRMSAV